MSEGSKVSLSGGVVTKHVIRELRTRRSKRNLEANRLGPRAGHDNAYMSAKSLPSPLASSGFVRSFLFATDLGLHTNTSHEPVPTALAPQAMILREASSMESYRRSFEKPIF